MYVLCNIYNKEHILFWETLASITYIYVLVLGHNHSYAFFNNFIEIYFIYHLKNEKHYFESLSFWVRKSTSFRNQL